MKIFLDAFIVYRDMESHLMKHRFYFQKCKEYKVNLNSEECAFMVFSGLILGFIISKEGKIPNLMNNGYANTYKSILHSGF